MLRFIPTLGFSALVVLLLTSSQTAQDEPSDTIYYKDGQVVLAQVVEFTANSVRYRLPDASAVQIQTVPRSEITLIFRDNGDFMLPNQPGVTWWQGAHPDFHRIVAINGQVFPAKNLQKHGDIIYYRDAVNDFDVSFRTSETLAIIYQDGQHLLLANANEVASGLRKAGDFAAVASSENDAVASVESIAAPPTENARSEELPIEGSVAPEEVDANRRSAGDEEAVAKASNPDSATASSIERTRTSSAFPASTPPPSTGPQTAPKALELDEVDYEEYAAKAVNKAEYLGYYLDQLCDQSLTIYDRDRAVANALQLFVHDSAWVQVSSVNQDYMITYKIKDYLERLSMLGYDQVKLLWRNVQYITKFHLGPDGNYYGTVTVEQVFQGFKDGQPIYEDITQKDVEVVLGNFTKQESGSTQQAWDVLLSDIGVEETRKK